MRNFQYRIANEAATATQTIGLSDRTAPPTQAPAQFIAGGTTILDLMKLDVMRPSTLIDINPLSRDHSEIVLDERGLRLGALARMADVANHEGVVREYPVVAQSLQLAASAQLRNMASLGGNVLQRTRCTYFRDTRWQACNKRTPGSGCAAMDGINRTLAILGTSGACIATYPGDWAAALIALDATIDLAGVHGSRTIRFAELHRPPGDTPHIETCLRPDEVITGFFIPAGGWTRRSLYLKVRDRQSYEFALAAAAVAIELRDGRVAEARIGLGGLATTPWRARSAETLLCGRVLDAASAGEAAEVALSGSNSRPGNAFRIELGKRTVVRALLAAAELEA